MTQLAEVIIDEIEATGARLKAAEESIDAVIYGQKNVIDQTLITILSGGHGLLIGVPGLAKTRLVDTVATVLGLAGKRVQFTPDLMPADIIGSEVLEESDNGRRAFRFIEGPVFCQLLMADEINRASPRTQSALLQAMQEKHVTVAGERYDLPEPFHVLATQNPLEQEGTYPLPEAQLDRFMFNIMVDYPSAREELAIMKQVTGTYVADLKPTLTGDDIIRLQGIVRRVPVAEHVFVYARDLARATRPNSIEAPKFINELVGWGAGPRAGIYMVLAAKARAILYGRSHTTTEDVRQIALPVLRHRVITTFNAEAAGVTSDDVVRRLLEEIKPDVKGIE